MKRLIVLGLAAAGLIFSGVTVSATQSSLVDIPSAEEAPAPKPCEGKQRIGAVKSACKKGGQKAAKRYMKSWVKKVKKAKKAKGDTGFKLTCKTCHTSLKGAYPLKSNGMSDFKKLSSWYKANK